MGTGARLLLFLVVTLAVLAGAFFGLTRRFTVELSTMEPNLKNGDHVAVFRFSDSVTPPGRKDVVVLSNRISPNCDAGDVSHYVERVIGLPDETVVERTGEFSIDGKPLRETYVAPSRRGRGSGRWHVPKDAYLVVGDNRREACAAPYVVLKKDVVGFVIFTFWPIDHVSID